MGARREQLVRDTFVELADTLASDYDIGDFLQMLVDRCGAILDVRTGGVLVEGSRGVLQLAAATSAIMNELEQLEIDAREGPCLEAYETGEQVVCGDLRETTDRWPTIAPKALEMGLLSVYALPVRLRDDRIGALNLYREQTGVFDDEEIRLAQAFADVAAIGILQARRVADAEERSVQLQGALDTRVIIEQAKGAVAERYGVTPTQAFAAIRSVARSSNRKVSAVCQEIVDGGEPVKL